MNIRKSIEKNKFYILSFIALVLGIICIYCFGYFLTKLGLSIANSVSICASAVAILLMISVQLINEQRLTKQLNFQEKQMDEKYSQLLIQLNYKAMSESILEFKKYLKEIVSKIGEKTSNIQMNNSFSNMSPFSQKLVDLEEELDKLLHKKDTLHDIPDDFYIPKPLKEQIENIKNAIDSEYIAVYGEPKELLFNDNVELYAFDTYMGLFNSLKANLRDIGKKEFYITLPTETREEFIPKITNYVKTSFKEENIRTTNEPIKLSLANDEDYEDAIKDSLNYIKQKIEEINLDYIEKAILQEYKNRIKKKDIN